jgi:hypothetical protein
MMRHYKNTATGAEIFTECEILSEYWIEIVESAAKTETTTPEKPNNESMKKSGRRAKK